MNGHGLIINLSNYAPFIFMFNPTEVSSTKKINYVSVPNIGGSHKKKYFTGFDTKEISFKIVLIDKESTFGVKPQISYFEQLRNPDPGYQQFGVAGSFFGNDNFPPPQILFQFGVSYVPVVWDVLNVDIKMSHFHDDIRGIMGVPKMAELSIDLSLVEDHPLNKANQIAEKASMIVGSGDSLLREAFSEGRRERWVMPKIKLPKIKIEKPNVNNGWGT